MNKRKIARSLGVSPTAVAKALAGLEKDEVVEIERDEESRVFSIGLKRDIHRIIDFFLKKYDDNVLKVAEILDIGKSTIYRYLKDKTI